MTVKSSPRSPGRIPLPQPRPNGRGVNSAWVRRVNAVLLMQALRRHPGSSQRELAVLTGLDKATVSAVTSQLVEAGLVARCNAATTVRRLGRPAVALEIPRSAGAVFGVRLEPDRIEVAAADLGGRIIDRESRPGAAEPREALRSLAAGLTRLSHRLGPTPQRAIGIGVPALIDKSGRLLFGPNLGWRDLPLAEMAAELLPAPVLIENDTNAAAIAEREFGSCTGIDDFIYISGHSGIGGAIFTGGRLYRGADGLAGEFGHIRVVPGGRICSCGGRGCLEAYASVPALFASLVERNGTASDIAEIAMHAEAGDPTVLALLAETGGLVGQALAGSVNALNPGHLVIGGPLTVVAPWMLTALRNALARAAMEQHVARLNIEPSPLGEDAVLMGGVALALQKVDADLLQAIPTNADSAVS
jgi:predicted NBD/HSP70 family sugar kinase